MEFNKQTCEAFYSGQMNSKESREFKRLIKSNQLFVTAWKGFCHLQQYHHPNTNHQRRVKPGLRGSWYFYTALVAGVVVLFYVWYQTNYKKHDAPLPNHSTEIKSIITKPDSIRQAINKNTNAIQPAPATDSMRIGIPDPARTGRNIIITVSIKEWKAVPSNPDSLKAFYKRKAKSQSKQIN